MFQSGSWKSVFYDRFLQRPITIGDFDAISFLGGFLFLKMIQWRFMLFYWCVGAGVFVVVVVFSFEMEGESTLDFERIFYFPSIFLIVGDRWMSAETHLIGHSRRSTSAVFFLRRVSFFFSRYLRPYRLAIECWSVSRIIFWTNKMVIQSLKSRYD